MGPLAQDVQPLLRAIIPLCLLACTGAPDPSVPGGETGDEQVLHTGPAPWTPEVGAVGVPTRVLMSGWTHSEAAARLPHVDHAAVASSPQALDILLQPLRIPSSEELWSSVDPGRESLIVLWGTPQEHTTDDIWLVAVWQVGGLVDIQWRIPEQGHPKGGRPWMVLAVQSPGVTDVLAELDYQPTD